MGVAGRVQGGDEMTTPSAILQATIDTWGVDPRDRCRRRQVSSSRHCMALLLSVSAFSYSLPEIAELMGRSDHTTALQAKKKGEQRMLDDERFEGMVVKAAKRAIRLGAKLPKPEGALWWA